MTIIQLVVHFQLPACRSLKEKRQRLGGLRQRFGRLANIAVAESGLQNAVDRGEWTFVVASSDPTVAQSQCAQLENALHEAVDGFICNIERITLQ